MADYKKMYFTLFHTITDIMEQLKYVQLETEQLYLTSSENHLKLLHTNYSSNEKTDSP